MRFQSIPRTHMRCDVLFLLKSTESSNQRMSCTVFELIRQAIKPASTNRETPLNINLTRFDMQKSPFITKINDVFDRTIKKEKKKMCQTTPTAGCVLAIVIDEF